jgi:hypothetical protein
MPVQAANPFGAFLEGRQARQQEQYGQTRNALAQLELEQAPRDIANQNALANRQQEQYSQDQIARSLQQTAAAAMRIAQSPNPRGELQANREFAANLMKQHPELAQMGDDDLKQYMGWIAGEAQSKLGVAPTPKLETLQTDGGGILQRDPTTGGLKQVVAPQKPDRFAETQAAADRRAVDARTHAERMAEEQRKFTADENERNRKAAAGLKTETANVKERVIAKQNEKAYATYQAGMTGLVKGLGGTNTGPIAGRMPAVTASQQIADGAVAAMAPVLKGLFRSAGEGTFTDKDQEMLLAMMPTRRDEPEARAAKLANVDAIVRAKLGLGGGADNQNQRPPLSSFQR